MIIIPKVRHECWRVMLVYSWALLTKIADVAIYTTSYIVCSDSKI